MPPKLNGRKGSSAEPQGKTGRNGHENVESTYRDCNTPVHNNDKTVICDLCEHWMHAQCQDIPDANYTFLSENDSNTKCYCNHCKVIATGVVTEVGKIAKSYQEMDRRVIKLETQIKSKTNEADLEQLRQELHTNTDTVPNTESIRKRIHDELEARGEQENAASAQGNAPKEENDIPPEETVVQLSKE